MANDKQTLRKTIVVNKIDNLRPLNGKILFCNGFVCSILPYKEGYNSIEEGKRYEIEYVVNNIYNNVERIRAVDSITDDGTDMSPESIEDLFANVDVDVVDEKDVKNVKVNVGMDVGKDVGMDVEAKSSEDMKQLLTGLRTMTNRLLDMLEQTMKQKGML